MCNVTLENSKAITRLWIAFVALCIVGTLLWLKTLSRLYYLEGAPVGQVSGISATTDAATPQTVEGISGFQSGGNYLLSVEDATGGSGDLLGSRAFKKLQAEVRRLDSDGWILIHDSIRIESSPYRSWIVAKLRK